MTDLSQRIATAERLGETNVVLGLQEASTIAASISSARAAGREEAIKVIEDGTWEVLGVHTEDAIIEAIRALASQPSTSEWQMEPKSCRDLDLEATERDGQFCDAIIMELRRARKKFPSSQFMLGAVMGEVGELANALLEYKFSTYNSWSMIYKEAVQVAVCAARLAIEGDPSIASPPSPELRKGDEPQ